MAFERCFLTAPAASSARGMARCLLLSALCLLLLVLTGCRTYNAPPQLVGMWQSEDQRYTGKFLQFDDKFVITGFGEEKFPKVQRIVGLKQTTAGAVQHFEFDLRDEEGMRDHLSLQYLPNNGGQVELSNPKNVIWKKTTPPPAE
ncbi:MAG: hypothetical protein P4M01_14180 [Acidobacteriota bacterium]|nr:hypothetical protein [Acidobacteriota bacterium]